MKGRTPTAEEKRWMARVAEMGCIVCKKQGYFTPCEIHHLDGKTKEGAHFKTIGLCFHHHRAGVDNELLTSRHPYKARFEKRYGNESELLNQTSTLVK